MHMRTVIKAQASVIDETYALLQEAINAYLGTEDAAAAVQAQAAADLREVCHMLQHSVGQLQHHAKQAADLHTRAQGDPPYSAGSATPVQPRAEVPASGQYRCPVVWVAH